MESMTKLLNRHRFTSHSLFEFDPPMLIFVPQVHRDQMGVNGCIPPSNHIAVRFYSGNA